MATEETLKFKVQWDNYIQSIRGKLVEILPEGLRKYEDTIQVVVYAKVKVSEESNLDTISNQKSNLDMYRTLLAYYIKHVLQGKGIEILATLIDDIHAVVEKTTLEYVKERQAEMNENIPDAFLGEVDNLLNQMGDN